MRAFPFLWLSQNMVAIMKMKLLENLFSQKVAAVTATALHKFRYRNRKCERYHISKQYLILRLPLNY